MNVIVIKCRCCFVCLYVDNYIWFFCINGICRCVCKYRERDRWIDREEGERGENFFIFL